MTYRPTFDDAMQVVREIADDYAATGDALRCDTARYILSALETHMWAAGKRGKMQAGNGELSSQKVES